MRALSFCLLLTTAAVTVVRSTEVPNFNVVQLQEDLRHGRTKEIIEAISGVGAFTLTQVPHSERFQRGLALLRSQTHSCFTKDQSGKVKKVNLDGGVTRTTSATFSAGLDLAAKHPDCVDTADIVETFNSTAEIVHDIIKTLVGGEPTFYEDESTKLVTKLKDTYHLDHIHMYEKMDDVKDNPVVYTVPYHRDNGLFLLLTPAAEGQSTLKVKDSRGQELTASQGEIIVLFGRGMQEWLLQSGSKVNFRAAPHAVPTLEVKDGPRVVFARMIVVPQKAVPKRGLNLIPFGSVFTNERDLSNPASMCTNDGGIFQLAQDDLCEEGFEYCWHTCLPLDSTCPPEEQSCTAQNGSVECCLADDEDCNVHDATCEWGCN